MIFVVITIVVIIVCLLLSLSVLLSSLCRSMASVVITEAKPLAHGSPPARVEEHAAAIIEYNRL